MKQNKENIVDKFITDLVTAGLIGDSGKVEMAALGLARSMRKDNPEIAQKINAAVSSFSLSNGAFVRGAGIQPLPVDSETQLEMATVIEPRMDTTMAPILDSMTDDRITTFLDERKNINRLLERGIRPSTGLLLIGEPGTGKTMLARYIAASLSKKLVTLDLSASISSLMGKTGANLKKVLNYAKQNASVLLFDEFDAIAKKRDDNTDLGEIKRVVNVLLMELEDWPVSSVLIATSNHPELLDRAIWRRFDHVIDINTPGDRQRQQLIKREFSEFVSGSALDESFINALVKLLEGKSAADICKFCDRVKRRSILKEEAINRACLQELDLKIFDKRTRGELCVSLKSAFGNLITVREIAEITGLSTTGVQHHLSKKNHE